MASKMVTYVTHVNKVEGETITVPACGEKCFFPKGHKGKHSAGKPEGIWAVSGIAIMYLTHANKGPTMPSRDRPEAPGLAYLAGFLARLVGAFGFATCGAGGVFNIRRSTSSSAGGAGSERLVMVGSCHG